MKKNLFPTIFLCGLIFSMSNFAYGELTRLENCIEESTAGKCLVKSIQYANEGTSCTENCIVKDVFGGCKLYEKCEFDSKSKCFIKHTCAEVNDKLKSCKKWKKEFVCK